MAAVVTANSRGKIHYIVTAHPRYNSLQDRRMERFGSGQSGRGFALIVLMDFVCFEQK